MTLTGCSGGSGGTGNTTSTTCGEAAVFCLTSCSLGCSLNGCELREIARNQRLRFQFSQAVDPGFVDFTTVSLKTATGDEPLGEFVVEGETITFVPDVQTVGASTFFGFAPNEEYILTLPGGDDDLTLRSLSGDKLTEAFTCVVRVSGGIIDLDGQPPRAEVLAPSQLADVSRDAQFVLKFSEIVDHAPFVLTPNGPDAPVQFILLPRNLDGSCDIAADRPPQIFGAVRLVDDTVGGFTTMTFTPTQSLPGNRCVQARVTGRVRDLAGTGAQSQDFFWRIDASALVEDSVVEEFADETNLDPLSSAGVWGGGNAQFFAVGGDGRHGDFDYEAGTRQSGSETYVFRTDEVYRGTNSARLPVDSPNGEYHFLNFIVPAGVTVRFEGPDPIKLRVAGVCDIRGTLSFNGVDQEQFDPNDGSSVGEAGQLGSPGGPGGAAGGQGGTQGDGVAAIPANNGSPGEDVAVDAGHAYAGQAAGTGGQGSTIMPVDGSSGSLTRPVSIYAGDTTNGGGGGGFMTAGSPGTVVEVGGFATNPRPPFPDADTPGGTTFQMFPIVGSSSDHFLVGGSGGGGGGSHALWEQIFIAGAGGAGGGGIGHMRIGRGLQIPAGGTLECRGGNGGRAEFGSAIGPPTFPAPGGGGSGGSLLIQIGSANDTTLLGDLDVRGGEGGVSRITSGAFEGDTRGGMGGDGVYRIESPAPISLSSLSAMPAPVANNTGPLLESDDLVSFTSNVYNTALAVAPLYTRYEIEATVDGAPVVFSDDPDVGSPAIVGEALQFWAQAFPIDPATGEPGDVEDASEWVRFVGTTPGEFALNNAQLTGFRWTLVADFTVASTVTVQKVSVFYVF